MSKDAWEKNMDALERVLDNPTPGPRKRYRNKGTFPTPGSPMQVPRSKDPATLYPDTGYNGKVRVVHDRDTSNQRFKSRKV